ncbi:enoyl-CoA hydratase-related protein, partial [Streptomyces sp. NPDC057623]|uniref:enoyl-CoA hydratase-related protein n=1 Tax=Streptomyces sp. NPDC057623 TaxID=3346187 RepID=UPI00368CEEE2
MTEQPLVRTEIKGSIAIVTLNRPEKRNALSQKLYYSLKDTFSELPDAVRAVVFTGEGKHFCAGLDLAEHRESEPFESSLFSRASHEIVKSIRYCGRPVISALQGAVIGGGFEMASGKKVRVAGNTTFLPPPQERGGCFFGGGGSVPLSRIPGTNQ